MTNYMARALDHDMWADHYARQGDYSKAWRRRDEARRDRMRAAIARAAEQDVTGELMDKALIEAEF